VPRLTRQEYVKRHRFLRKQWLDSQMIYSVLSPEKQWALHRYYQPNKDLDEPVLLAHRKQITKEQPSLPSRASKAFWELIRFIAAAAEKREAATPIHEKGKGRGPLRVEVTGVVVRPEIDWDRYAYALLQHTKIMRERSEVPPKT
jgi:hypothetical protein